MALEVRIKKSFPDFKLDVEFRTGEEVFGVLGESGCGKSLTLKCIAGIEKPDEGRIVLNGRTLFDSEQGINVPARERRVGYLFQEYALFPHMTVEENIAVGAGVVLKQKKKRDKKEKEKLVKQYMERFFLIGLEKKYPSELSGGQKQRVAIARMMVTEPELILLDEPFSAIDSYLKWKMEQQLTEWLERAQVTTLLVSHNRDEIYRLCDKMGVIHCGHMEVCGRKKEIFQNPQTVSAAILTGCKNIMEAVGNRKENGITHVGIRAHDIQMYEATDEYETKIEEDSGNFRMLAVVERKIEAPFDYIYVVRLKAREKESVRVEIPKSEETVFEQGQDVILEIPKEKLLWLRG